MRNSIRKYWLISSVSRMLVPARPTASAMHTPATAWLPLITEHKSLRKGRRVRRHACAAPLLQGQQQLLQDQRACTKTPQLSRPSNVLQHVALHRGSPGTCEHDHIVDKLQRARRQKCRRVAAPHRAANSQALCAQPLLKAGSHYLGLVAPRQVPYVRRLQRLGVAQVDQARDIVEEEAGEDASRLLWAPAPCSATLVQVCVLLCVYRERGRRHRQAAARWALSVALARQPPRRSAIAENRGGYSAIAQAAVPAA